MSFEILDLALMFFGLGARSEGAKVAALAGLRVHLTGIEPILAGFELADHAASTALWPLPFPARCYYALKMGVGAKAIDEAIPCYAGKRNVGGAGLGRRDRQ